MSLIICVALRATADVVFTTHIMLNRYTSKYNSFRKIKVSKIVHNCYRNQSAINYKNN